MKSQDLLFLRKTEKFEILQNIFHKEIFRRPNGETSAGIHVVEVHEVMHRKSEVFFENDGGIKLAGQHASAR